MGQEITATTPSFPQLIQLSIEKGGSIEQVEKLLEMQERWEKREAEKAFAAAMSAFRAEVPVIVKNAQGHNTQYASLDFICQKIDPVLAKHGLSYYWDFEESDSELRVCCIVEHALGHSRRFNPMSAPADDSGKKNPIQAKGSTLTYLRRYTLEAAIGIASGGEDNDGNSYGVEFIDDGTAEALEQYFADDAKRNDDTDQWREKFYNWAKIDSLSDIPAKNVRTVEAALIKAYKLRGGT